MNKIFKNAKNESLLLLDTVTSREIKKLKAGQLYDIDVDNISLVFERNADTSKIEMSQLDFVNVNVVVKHDNTIVLTENEYNGLKNGTPLVKKDFTLIMDDKTGDIYVKSNTVVKDFIIR